MKRMYKISSLLLIIAMLIIIFTGCGGNSSTTTASSSTSSASNSTVQESTQAAAGETTVTWDKNKKDKVVLSVINNYYTAGEKKLATDYMALHPETEVVVDVVASNDAYMTNLKTKYASDKNTLPDIVHGNFATPMLGTWTASYDKGLILDMTPMLDEINPYNENKKVREAFNEKDIALAISNAEGKLGFMPFDWVGAGVYYNKTVFDKLGLKTPASVEEWLDICKKLKDAGYAVPISASGIVSWVRGMYADIAYRPLETQFLSLPGDAAYDEVTMKANKDIKYDSNNALFDQYAVFNAEKMVAFAKKNTYNTPVDKQIWDTFFKIAQYFQKNFQSTDDTKVINDFETQASPMMIHGSWNTGKLIDEINKLPKDKQFDWGTFKVPGYANPPAGFEAKIRSLYVFGNQMSILVKDNKDHMARVEDVYKYWMSPKVAQMMYEETLANGNYVQGPPAILGVTLSEENSRKLDGFKSEGNMRQEFSHLAVGDPLQSDIPVDTSLQLKLLNGEITLDTFMAEHNKLAMKGLDDLIKRSGFDLNPATKDTAKQ